MSDSLRHSREGGNPQSLITENLDIWTSAIKTKSASGRGSSNKLDLYGIKKLRELILELAVRGKLVPQDPNEEPASELLKRIEAEKAQLIIEKKIKKPKKLPPFDESDMGFSIPSSWEFDRLGNIVSIVRGITFPASEKQLEEAAGRVACLRTANIQDKIDWNDLIYVDEKFVKRTDQYLMPEDIVMSMANSRELVGKVAFADSLPTKASFGGFLSVLRPYKLLPAYVMLFLRTSYARSNLIASASQTTNIANISLEKLNPLVFPVPPVEEQARIATKVDELMSLCDLLESQTEASIQAHKTLVETLLATLTNAKNAYELDESWQRISQHFDVLFTTEDSIDQLKQTILQLAVMGKLVKQDPNDEPASKLLERIAAEKEKLIKEKKIKKQKPLPPISDDEKPFELPEGWEWCRIGNASVRTDYGLSDKSSGDIEGVPVLAMGQIQDGQVFLDVPKKVPSNVDSLPELYLEHRDLLYNRTNSAELVGKTGIFLGIDNTYTYASYLIRIRTIKDSQLPEIINLNMQSPEFRKTQIVPHLKQQCGQANVNGTIMKNMLIAIPPENEICRIVDKVKTLFKFCDELKANLEMAQSIQNHLADAITTNVA